jgi:competence protein ComEA
MVGTARAGLVAGLAVVALSIGLPARQEPSAIVPSGEGLPDAPGKDLTVRMCGVCHEARRAASVRLTREGWTAVVDAMVKRGAVGTDAEIATVIEYLSTNFIGEAPRPLNVNAAPQIDLELVGGLLRREAAAVVQYREKNGPFKSLDEMKNVPGLDFQKIDGRRDFLVAMVLGPEPRPAAPQQK